MPGARLPCPVRSPVLATLGIRGISRRIMHRRTACRLPHGTPGRRPALVARDGMPRVRSAVADLLLVVATVVRALAHRDVVRSVLGVAADLLRPRAELVAENALLRQQLLVLRCQVARPGFTMADRWWMVI